MEEYEKKMLVDLFSLEAPLPAPFKEGIVDKVEEDSPPLPTSALTIPLVASPPSVAHVTFAYNVAAGLSAWSARAYSTPFATASES
jgi:hypothetical protein